MDSPSNITDDKKELDQKTIDDSSASNQDLENKSEDSSDSETSEPDNRTTLDLVKEAMQSKGKDDEKNKGNQDKDGSKVDDKSEDESKLEDDSEESEEQLKAWKSKLKADTRDRFEKLQKRDFQKKQKIDSLEIELKEFKADASFKHQYDDFCSKNNLSTNEANILFDIGALMKNNPDEALKKLTPYYNQLLEVTGNVLPPDLAKQVKEGYINKSHAYEISRQRAMIHHNNVVSHTQNTQQDQLAQQTHQKLSTDIQGALANLESNWQKSDPDYKFKSSRVQDRMKLTWLDLSRSGQMPRSIAEATQLAENVKKEVEKEMRQFMPRKSVNTVESGGNVVRPTAQPKSTLDIIRQSRG